MVKLLARDNRKKIIYKAVPVIGGEVQCDAAADLGTELQVSHHAKRHVEAGDEEHAHIEDEGEAVRVAHFVLNRENLNNSQRGSHD